CFAGETLAETTAPEDGEEELTDQRGFIVIKAVVIHLKPTTGGEYSKYFISAFESCPMPILFPHPHIHLHDYRLLNEIRYITYNSLT
ncbi:MAG: hypothetical protein MI702_13235, partial [Chlorobiales bacterium]|nr:hypothetical protein [Chlorobiales bacterium]